MIERNETIRFHEQGTLDAVTRWIATHHDGIAELLKNVRRQYQVDRADVASPHRVAVLLLREATSTQPARIGVLDVGGATLEDVTAWSVWQDPDASGRGSQMEEEDTQGNGGKAYMYRLFTGPARILGIRERRKNCKGFDGEAGTVVRGTPGWIPTVSGGRDVETSSFDGELEGALARYGVSFEELPQSARTALKARQAFTLVEGESPTLLYKGRIDPDELIQKVVRHEQATICLEQVDIYAIHNGRALNGGRKLVLPAITPYPGFETPTVWDIPAELPLEGGQLVSTTESDSKEPGRLILHTSLENMPNAYKNLKPRWQLIYRTRHQMVGAKAVSEIAPATPGTAFVYGSLELQALEPAYVEHGRRRPKDGPLIEALDRFAGEKVRELAHSINARRKQELDAKSLDEVHVENRKLDEFKNRFLPAHQATQKGGSGTGGPDPEPPQPPHEWGTEPDSIEYVVSDEGLCVGKGVAIPLRTYMDVIVRDTKGRPVRAVLDWHTSDNHVAIVARDGMLQAREKGECEIWTSVKGSHVKTDPIRVRVWVVDHVLLTPRSLEIPLGTRRPLTAEVTDDEGRRSTSVLLDWAHDAEDQLTVRINHDGIMTGNRVGRAAVRAGAGGVWARIPSEISVIPNPERLRRGGSHPRLLLTEKDVDPATGMTREGNPDMPALWQEPSDFLHNVWWLNLQSPEAAFAFKQRASNAPLWRTYHSERLIEMVVEVWMMEEFTKKGDSQRPEMWAAHLAAIARHRVRMVQAMWKGLEPYVTSGAPEEEEALV